LKDWINAFSICIFGCTIAFFLKEGAFKDKEHVVHAGTLPRATSDRSPVSANVMRAMSEEPSSDVEMPIAYVPSNQNQLCAAYDTVAHPEQILDVLTLASQRGCRTIKGVKICAPVEVLYAIWRIETGHVDGAGLASGRCDLMEELRRRDGAAGTKHGAGMLRMAEKFKWNKVYGENLERMTCSCPKIVDDKDPVTGDVIGKKKYGYGGCCGPFQFSGAEVVDWAIEQNLDPLSFCGGALIASQDIVLRYERAIKKGYAHGVPAWRRAISSYYGRDPKSEYYLKALSKWETIYGWQACELKTTEDGTQSWTRKSNGEVCDQAALERQWDFVRSQIVAQSMRSVRYHQSLRQ
jgi:hypothetical protein